DPRPDGGRPVPTPRGGAARAAHPGEPSRTTGLRLAMSDERPTTPLQALDVIGTQEAELAPGLRHLEIYTMTGLITLLWHGDEERPVGVVAGGGAMGGLRGPASGLYQRLGEQLPKMGIGVIRLSYRQPNDIPKCTLDLAAGVQIAVGHGAAKVVTMGHSF